MEEDFFSLLLFFTKNLWEAFFEEFHYFFLSLYKSKLFSFRGLRWLRMDEESGAAYRGLGSFAWFFTTTITIFL